MPGRPRPHRVPGVRAWGDLWASPLQESSLIPPGPLCHRGAQFGHEGSAVAADSAKALVAALQRPRRPIVTVQAGRPTGDMIAEYAPLLDPGDVIVDGGNAHFADTRRREAALRERGIHFLGAGISGGEEGALKGPGIMPGGSPRRPPAAGARPVDCSRSPS
ncbi:NAD(P)-binding domain-containing protein [Streptomyces sp. NPDC048342]|uniref:NAD(P)-binding domain-containing protein n=1 Tax=unclassified Streptomyces TaxID=2593676 RepID=UPI00343982A5